MSDEELRIDEFGTIIEPVLDDCELYRLMYYPVPDPPSKKVPKYKPLSPLPLPQEKSDSDNDDVVWVCSKLTSDNTTIYADGTIVYDDGTVCKPNGEIFYPEGTIEIPRTRRFRF